MPMTSQSALPSWMINWFQSPEKLADAGLCTCRSHLRHFDPFDQLILPPYPPTSCWRGSSYAFCHLEIAAEGVRQLNLPRRAALCFEYLRGRDKDRYALG